jgi:hypothetical protein
MLYMPERVMTSDAGGAVPQLVPAQSRAVVPEASLILSETALP